MEQIPYITKDKIKTTPKKASILKHHLSEKMGELAGYKVK